MWCPESQVTVPGVRGVEEAVAKGSGRGQNSIHTTGGTWATCMCRQWVSRTQVGGSAGQLSRVKERKFKKNRMTACLHKVHRSPLEGTRVLGGGGACVSLLGHP